MTQQAEILDTPAFVNTAPWLVTHRAIRSLLPLILWGCAAVYIAYLFSISTPAIFIPEMIPYIGGLRIGTLWLLPISIFLEAIRRYFNDLYIFDSHRITHHRGRVSLHYNVPVVKYIHIRAITVKQSILGRILNYGDVAFGTAAEEGSELIVRGARDPRSLAKAVDFLRRDISRMDKAQELEIRSKLASMAS